MNEGNEGIIAIHQTDAFQKCCGAIKYMETNAHKYEDPQLYIYTGLKLSKEINWT